MEDVIQALAIGGLADSASAAASCDPPAIFETDGAATGDGGEPTRVVDRPTTRLSPRAGFIAGATGLIGLLVAAAAMFWDRPNAVDAPNPDRFILSNQAGGPAQDLGVAGQDRLNAPSQQGQAGLASNQPVRSPVAERCHEVRTSFMFSGRDQDALGPLDRAVLDGFVVNRHPRHLITIIGQNAGASGDTARTARRRANVLAAYLAQRGVPRSTITVFASPEAVGRAEGVPDPEARRFKITARCG
jgi:hypothetical protein